MDNKRKCGTMETEANKKIIAKETFLDSEFDTDENIHEYFDDEDDYEGSDFDEFDFMGSAKDAAMQDIEASGEKFVDLGQSEYEKNISPEDFIGKVKQANLRLPNDEKEVNSIQNMLDKKRNHEKTFGHGTLNEEEFKKRLLKAVLKKLKTT